MRNNTDEANMVLLLFFFVCVWLFCCCFYLPDYLTGEKKQLWTQFKWIKVNTCKTYF